MLCPVGRLCNHPLLITLTGRFGHRSLVSSHEPLHALPLLAGEIEREGGGGYECVCVRKNERRASERARERERRGL